MRKFIKNIIGKLIEKIEYLMWKDCPVIDNKFIRVEPVEDEVMTDKGRSPAMFIHRTVPYQVWRVILENDIEIECADDHVFFTSDLREKFTRDLTPGDTLFTDNGAVVVKSVEQLPYKHCMYDLMVNDENHRYYTNGILSHNTISSSIYLAWYLLFNYDKTCFLCGNIEKTAVDILGKVVDVIKNVPFYMKPGVIKGSSLEWKFDNGCRLMGAATTKRAGIGFTIHCLYLDEFAHVDKGIIDEFFDNIYPTVSSLPDSKIIVTSTPNGMNRFYKIYDAATKGINSFVPFRIDWWQVPDWDKVNKCWKLRGPDWMDTQIAQLGNGDEELGRERFGAQYGNSFLSTGSLLLGPNALKRLEEDKEIFVEKPIADFEDAEIDEAALLRWKQDFEPEDAKHSDDMFLFSVDLSEGNGGDNTVLNVFKMRVMDKKDWENIKAPNNPRDFVGLEQVGLFAYNRIHLMQFAKMLYILSHKVFNPENVKILLEWNAFGGEVLNCLKTVFGDRNDFDVSTILRFKRSIDSQKLEPGLRLNRDNKLIYCQNAKKNIGNGRMVIHEENTIQEFNLFGRNGNSWAAITDHDDRVMTCVDANAFFDTREFEWMADFELEKDNEVFHEIITIIGEQGDQNTDYKSLYAVGAGNVGGMNLFNAKL